MQPDKTADPDITAPAVNTTVASNAGDGPAAATEAEWKDGAPPVRVEQSSGSSVPGIPVRRELGGGARVIETAGNRSGVPAGRHLLVAAVVVIVGGTPGHIVLLCGKVLHRLTELLCGLRRLVVRARKLCTPCCCRNS